MTTVATNMSATPTAAPLGPLETHAEWRADDVADPEEWTLRLTPDHHAELDDALARARSAADDLLDVGIEDFPLPDARAAAR